MSTETTRTRVPAARATATTSGAVRRGLGALPSGRVLDLLRSGHWVELGLIAAVLIGVLVVRMDLRPWASNDYDVFLVHWFDHLDARGFAGLGVEFANYNMPYLYLLYLGTLLPIDALTCVKAIGAVSDLAMALGCVAVLLRLKASRELALIGGAAVLLLPEVLLNSAAWGQADSTYCALLVWAIWAAVGGRQRATWILFALAFSFKLQAAFVLPAFVVVHVTRRWGWRGPLLGVAALLATEVPALIAGRSPGSLAAIYLNQTSGYTDLTLNAPSVYALLPTSQQDLLRASGVWFALACVALLTYVVLRAARLRPLDGRSTVLFVAALATLAPWVLPMMHERYFYVANVLLFVLAVTYRRLLPWALLAQLIAVSAYSPFLFGMAPVVPMGLLAVAQGVVLVVVVRELLRAGGAGSLAAAPRPAGVA